MKPAPADRIYPLTRLIAGLVVPVLALAFIILYFFPASSGERFAWAIKPPMTALFIGAGYLGGGYLFFQVALGGAWHRVTHGFPTVAIFTLSMLIATVLHWDRFDLRHFPFQLWLILYIVTPFLIPGLWLWNRREDPGQPETGDREVPQGARWAMVLAGVGFAGFALLGLFYPDALIQIWVWPLTPLTARVLAGWFALLAMGGLTIGRERRWSAWKYGLTSIFLWHALVLVGALFHPEDFGEAGLLNWYLILVSLALIGMGGLATAMEWKKRGS